jgi:hypothetical protein
MVILSSKSLLLVLFTSIYTAGLVLAGDAFLLAEAAPIQDLSGATIPEPTVFGLIGVVGFLLMLRRRR